MDIYYDNLADLLKWDGLNVAYVASRKGMGTNVVTHLLYRNALTLVNLYDDLDLSPFNAVILASDIDEVYLQRVWPVFEAYLASGGVLVNFSSNHFGLLPNAQPYIQSPHAIKDRFIKASEFEIFQGVTEYDLNYRRGVKGFFNRGYIVPPIGSYEVLQDNFGQCICYIDTQSTNGIIINTAGSCFLSFGIFENTTARRLGINFLSYLQKLVRSDKKDIHYPEYEVKQAKPLDEAENVHLRRLSEINPRSDLKRAMVVGGTSHHLNLFKNKNAKYQDLFDKVIYQFELENEDLSAYDYVVIGSRCNDEVLVKSKEKLAQFVEQGGHIVSFGGSHGSHLPDVTLNDYPVNFWWWTIEGASMSLFPYKDHPLFETLNLADCKWHYHGGYIAPEGADKILINEIGESIIYKYKNHYITSLDPDYHFGQGFMPKTEVFFDRFLEWVESDIAATKGLK